MVALSIHPWLLGQPHRIAKLEKLLEYTMAQPGMWSASASQIMAAGNSSKACIESINAVR